MARLFQGLKIRRMVHKDNKPRKKLFKGVYTKKISTPSYSHYSRSRVPYSTAKPRKRKVLVKKKRR